MLIPYSKPKPANVIADLDARILRLEPSGVLNWMMDGLEMLCADGWVLHMNARQQAIVDNLLLESDGVTWFVREATARAGGSQLTVADCFEAYVKFCNERDWTTLARKKFGDAIGDAVTREHGLTVRHDVRDVGGKAQRGWNGLRLREETPKPSQKPPSDMSENSTSDAPDGPFPVQQGKGLVEELL